MNRQRRWSPEWFRCPICTGRIERIQEKHLSCTDCDKKFKIINDIPVFFNEKLKPEEIDEKIFWETKYDSQTDGSFKTLTDGSYQEVLNHFSIPTNALGLEFGCGSGAFSDFINHSTMVGLDISFTLLDQSVSIIPIQGSGEILPFCDQLFDFVLCCAALHHIPNLSKAMKEISRVLKAEGKIYIFEPNTHHLQRKLVAKMSSPWRKIFKTTHFSPVENLIPEKTMVAVLAENAFVLQKKLYLSPRYRSPTMLGKLQEIISSVPAKIFLSKYVDSYYLIQANLKNDE